MIYRADIIKTEQPDHVVDQWLAATDAQANQPGFVESKLHKIYKFINKTGYQLISITGWEDESSYDAVRSNPKCFGFLEDSAVAPRSHLYEVINHGANNRYPSTLDNLIVTNPYRITEAEAEKNAAMWNDSKEHMKDRDGFVNANLYQSLTKQDEYFFVSRAEWASEEQFLAQFQGKDFKKIVEPFESIFSICFSKVIYHVKG